MTNKKKRARDPVLAAKLLKLSNSSLFTVGREITTLQRAMMILGMKTVKLMSLSFSLVGTVPRNGAEAGFDIEEYWRRFAELRLRNWRARDDGSGADAASVAQRVDVGHLVAEVVQAGLPRIGDPSLGGLLPGLVDRDVGLVGPDVDPTQLVRGLALAANAELREGCLKKTDRRIHVADGEVGVIESNGHGFLLAM